VLRRYTVPADAPRGTICLHPRCSTRAGRVRSHVSRRSPNGTGVEPPNDGLRGVSVDIRRQCGGDVEK
jgi:hypothetical protein